MLRMVANTSMSSVVLDTQSTSTTGPVTSRLSASGAVSNDTPRRGRLPGLIGRLDHGTRVRPELKHMKRLPSEYLRRFTYDTIGHDDRINLNLVRLVGADRVVLGSDYCFDMGLADPVGTVNRLEAVPAAERELILGKTAAKLLRLE
jgi:Amidohydrolase